MSQIGRNEPCPCGSGKKYKKCCLVAAASAPAGAWTQAERQSALIALGRFAWRHEFDGDRAVAEQLFWGDALDLAPEALHAEVLRHGEVFFQDWFTTDFRLAGGRPPIELFLEREGRRLRSGELRYLERARPTHLRLYEVLAVRPDEGFDLLDLWARKRIPVKERLATRQVVQWNVLAARVMVGADGLPVLDGAPHLYPARAKDDILKELRSLHRRFRRRFPGDDADFFKRFGRLFFLWWIVHVFLASRPNAVTPEGDEVVFANAVFDVRDREAVERALAGHADVERQDDGSYAWFEPGGTEEFRRGLGAFVLKNDRLVLETMSKARAERGRAFVEGLAADAVRYRTTRLESVERALERRPARPARPERPEAEVPPEVQAEIVGAFYEKHYRGWVDEPLPALRGQTPREAAQSKTGRPRVVALLKDMESLSARERLQGRPAYDFGWMWAELGLDRPG